MRAFPLTGLILKLTCLLTTYHTGAPSTDHDAGLKIFSQERSSEGGSIRTAILSTAKSMIEMRGINEMALKTAHFSIVP